MKGEDLGRIKPWDWSDAATSQGLPATTSGKNKARRGPLLELSEVAWPYRQQLDFRRLASKTMRGKASVVLSSPAWVLFMALGQ